VALAIINRSRMYGTSAIDPVAFGGAIAVLLLTMLLASIIPASRAARIDPAIALRSD
jgi:ABC-type antimicrobial peptide transport system permease subunit